MIGKLVQCSILGSVPKVAGVYAVSHLATDRHYVGYATNVKYRTRRHGGSLRAGTSHSSGLQDHWNATGGRGWTKHLLEAKPTDPEEAELRWMAHYEGRLLNRIIAHMTNKPGSEAASRAMSEYVKEWYRLHQMV